MHILDWFSSQLALSSAELAQVRASVAADLSRADEVLNRLGLLSEENAEKIYNEHYGIPSATDELLAEPNSGPFAGRLNLNFLMEHLWLPCSERDGCVLFVSPDPLNRDVLQYLAVSNIPYRCYYLGETPFRRWLSVYQHSAMLEDSERLDPEQALALAEETPTVNLVNSLITRSVKMGASDMHIEPYQGGYRVRVRVDGLMADLDVLPPHLQFAAISRVKILSGMDISERRRPQDGKIAMELPGLNFDIRVSTLPLGEGESVVMRFLFNESVSHELAEVGMPSDVEQALRKAIQRTSGVILLTGPTGSGKTTTLYALLSLLNTTERKIVTLEDPIEYTIDGINQMQVRPEIGFDFAAGLRSVVRQDPDIIMVGEIRDAETARIALQSAITGHLVFSTVHTNDAPSAYTRLRELGVDHHLLHSGLIAVVAQRLIRALCKHCRRPLDTIPELLEERARKRHEAGQSVQVHEPIGCSHCNHTGYAGRLPIVEYMPCDEEIIEIDENANFSLVASKKLREMGYRSLYQDGIERVLNGETTLAEVIRVAG